jgi:hypothetical protein
MSEATVYTRANWQDTIEAMHSGAVIEIDEEIFDYFLEVLPPVYMHRFMEIGGRRRQVVFGFAEGAEPVTAFWREGVRFYCQRMNHT